jgi:LmbE family N-acetylglucosaminyl deacetylase
VINQKARPLESFALRKALHLLVLAPHPDDFDAIGVTLRFFMKRGNPIDVAVATSGTRGVEDSFCSRPTLKAKTIIREQEQRASCRFFGLPETHLIFLRLEEDQNGNLLDNEINADHIKQHFLNKRPQMVFLPHGNDTNRAHQMVYAMFRKVARETDNRLVAFLMMCTRGSGKMRLPGRENCCVFIGHSNSGT